MTEQPKPELLPCPFCGKPFVQVYGHDTPPYLTYRLVRVRCDNCFVETCNYATAAEAITAWNTRKTNETP